MSCTIKKNVIKLTKGDSLTTKISITDSEGNVYEPDPADRIRFAIKKNYDDEIPIIIKDIPYDTLVLRLESADTKLLEPGDYHYDIEITMTDGSVDTFIENKFIVTNEVY